MRIPLPISSAVGRDAEIVQLSDALRRVPIAVIYGVAGVGKSTLAFLVAQRWAGRVVYHKVAREDQTLEALVDDLRRQLAGGPVKARASDAERLDALGEQLDEASALCVLDDLHRLDRASRSELLSGLGHSLRRGRVVITARELVALSVDLHDHVELRLAGLSEDHARALWSSLDDLHRPSGGFDASFVKSHGNPLLLRRAHAGGLEGEDPIVLTVQSLGALERKLAGALALTEQRLPSDWLAAFEPGDVGLSALRALVRLMVVEVDAVKTCTVHDLFRDAIRSELRKNELEPLHDALAAFFKEASIDPVVRAREVCRHLRARGRHEEATRFLFEQSTELIRHGAAGELLRGIDAVPAALRTPELQIARARTLARLGDHRAAYDELERLVAAGVEPRFELKLAFGQLGTLTANFESAERALSEVLATRPIPPLSRMRAQTALALVHTHTGRGPEARAFLTKAIAKESEPLYAAHLRFCHAFSLWIDGREEEAEEPMRHVHAIFRSAAPSFRAGVLAPAFSTALMARLGHFEEAEEALAAAESAMQTSEDIRTRFELMAIRGFLLCERGERIRGLEYVEVARRGNIKTGNTTAQLMGDVLAVETLFSLGRRVDALALLEETRRSAATCGMRSIERMGARALRYDPVVRVRDDLDDPKRSASKLAQSPTSRAYAALRAARAGEAGKARATLDRLLPTIASADFAIERAVAAIAEALLARLAGNPTAAESEIARAEDLARAAGADSDLIASIVRAVDAFAIVAPSPRARTPTRPRASVVIDRDTHEIRIGEKIISLKRRRILRRLLYALAQRPGHAVSRHDLVGEVWSANYHPLVHDNVLLVSVTRLRGLLAKTGIRIDVEDGGVRLVIE